MNKYSLVSMRRCTLYNYSNNISVLVFYISFDLRIRAVEKVVTTSWAPLLTNEKDSERKPTSPVCSFLVF
jgi:hypothetical protein